MARPSVQNKDAAGKAAAALGLLEGLAPEMVAALEPAGDFSPLPEPGPHDWLAHHPEPGQTFEEFIGSRPNVPGASQGVIYLQPLEDYLPPGKTPPMEPLIRFARAFFGMEVRSLEAGGLSEGDAAMRLNPYSGQVQLLAGDIMAFLRQRLPDDAFCLLGITMRDLYPEPSWNFVFGQASLRDRVGVYSLARYDPAHYHNDEEPLGGEALLLKRACKVLAHETCHMFGIHHCIYYRCLMNGSNNLAENDGRPLHLCPVDLRKLQDSAGFDILERYRELLSFTTSARLEQEAAWLSRRIAHISAA